MGNYRRTTVRIHPSATVACGCIMYSITFSCAHLHHENKARFTSPHSGCLTDFCGTINDSAVSFVSAQAARHAQGVRDGPENTDMGGGRRTRRKPIGNIVHRILSAL